jgi:hypothetical protein
METLNNSIIIGDEVSIYSQKSLKSEETENLLEKEHYVPTKYWHIWNICEKLYINIKFFICCKKNLKVEDLEIGKKYYVEYNGSFDKYNVYLPKFYRIPYTLEMAEFSTLMEVYIHNGLIRTKVGFNNVKLLFGEPYGLNLIPNIDDIYIRDASRYNFYTF